MVGWLTEKRTLSKHQEPRILENWMRLFYSPGQGDPMLLDTESGLLSLHARLAAFLRSEETMGVFPARTDGSPDPYATFLPGLRVIKDDAGLRLVLDADGWLVLQGSISELAQCCDRFLVTEAEGHKHIYSTPIALIIEADNDFE